ncbi:NERD domain protein [Methanobacterium lacus]|uniref:NERD domain protein n=1 Tax=Methanobacterium lacus (strain AL-21) TaxID=877455 RepID=F0T8I4_METLA|nr:nuclease-related domain-containing protein [Methanobacterium lacus]ADZ09735.1 NERD domain protein [Methanobacterium lacus]
MVSNKEIVDKYDNGLLVCLNCEYSYALEPGESPDDFILKCSCGGKLNYQKSEREIQTRTKGFAEKKSDQNKFKKRLGLYSCTLGAVVFVGSIIMSQVVLGMIALFLSVFVGTRLYSSGVENGKRWNKGILGEKRVIKYLNMLPEAYFVFNDVKFPGSYGDLDHIVVGPTGIFVIETKNYQGSYVVKEDGWYYQNGEGIKKSKGQPGKQVMRNAMSLKRFMATNNINMKGVWIDPIVTLVNNNFEIIEKPEYYNVLSPSAIPKFIVNKKNHTAPSILQRTIDLIEPYCTELSYLEEDRAS